MTNSAPAPLYSIIVPLPDDQGRPLGCVESWARGQTFPRTKLQLVVVAHPEQFHRRAAMADLLDPRDLWVPLESNNLFEMYDAGATRAGGRTLLFTEAYCTADPRCLEEVDRYLAGGTCAGASLHSEGDSGHWLARLEERRHAEEMGERSRPGDWRKVNVRGFAIERAAYLSAGGFEPRYLHFAGWELAARLHRQGHRLGYVPSAVLRRRDDSPSLAKVLAGIRFFVEGECLFRSAHGEEEVSPYFGRVPEFAERELYTRAAARTNLVSLLRSSLRTGAPPLARDALRWVPVAVLGVRWPLAISRRRLRRTARKVLRRRSDPERGFRAFQEFNGAAVRVSRLEFLARRPAEPPRTRPGSSVRPAPRGDSA